MGVRPQINRIVADISTATIYLRSVKKWGKTTLFRDVIMEKYGDPSRGLLIGCGSEIGYSFLDNLNYVQVTNYAELVELCQWLVETKGKEHNIEIVAFDTVDELVQIAYKETIARYIKESGKACKSIAGAWGGYKKGEEYASNNVIKPLMFALKNAGFGIWAIAHTSFKTIKNKGDLDDNGYQQLTSNLEKNAESAFGDIFDFVFTGVIDRTFNTKVKDGFNGKKVRENFIDEEVRKLYFRGTSMIDAGGRFAFGAVPEYMVFDKGNMAAEFIKIVEDGIEKSKTDLSPVKKNKTPVKKVEIKADADEDNEPTENTMFDDNVGDPTEDLNSLKNAIVEKCKQLGGTKSAVVMDAVKKYGNPNGLKTIEDAKEFLNMINQ